MHAVVAVDSSLPPGSARECCPLVSLSLTSLGIISPTHKKTATLSFFAYSINGTKFAHPLTNTMDLRCFLSTAFVATVDGLVYIPFPWNHFWFVSNELGYNRYHHQRSCT